MSDCCTTAIVVGGRCLGCGKIHDLEKAFQMLHSTLMSMSNPHNLLLIDLACGMLRNMLDKYEDEQAMQNDLEYRYDKVIAIFKQDDGWDSPDPDEPGIFKDMRQFMIDAKSINPRKTRLKENNG